MVTQDMLRKISGKHDFSEIDFRYATALDLNKCHNQIKLTISPIGAHQYLVNLLYKYHDMLFSCLLAMLDLKTVFGYKICICQICLDREIACLGNEITYE